MSQSVPRLGVVIVSYQSREIIDECLESLFSARSVDLRVAVVDNNSSDDTCQVIADWASGERPYRSHPECPFVPGPPVRKPIGLADVPVGSWPEAAPVTLLRSPFNGGYAFAVNLGIAFLLGDPAIDLIWVLNPDCVVPPGTAAAIVACGAEGGFSLMGGRTIYYERPDHVQTDGGKVSRWTGRCISLNSGLHPATTPLPQAAALDYITGASVVATRAFIKATGPMKDDYFLYYEEVDWAFRRKALPLRVCPDMIVYHRGGTTIGTGSTTRRASPFANYFNFRNRTRFVRRFMPSRLPFSLAYSLAKAAQLFLKGAAGEAYAIVAGALWLPPPPAVRARIADETARAMAFGKRP